MALFVRAMALLVGLANALVIGDPLDVVGSSNNRPLAALFGTLLLAVVVGLGASEVVLRLGRPALGGGFFARYGITVLGMCLGGAILGGSSLALGLLTSQPGAQGPEGGVALLVYAALAYGSIAAVVGGVLGALEGLILALPLAAILGRFRHMPQDHRRGLSLPGAALLSLLMVAAITSYIAAPAPEAETADLNDNPPPSCPGYPAEEVATFRGPGSRATPVFETTGDGWGYEFASSGPGFLSISVLDEDENTVGRSDEFPPGGEASLGEGVGGTEFAFSGTFSLQIEADAAADYRVLVCD